MPIHVPAAPPDAANALRDALSSLIAQPATGGHIRELAAAAPIDLSAPHPVYVASAQDIVDRQLLVNAQLIGWRTIVSKDDQPLAAAEVDNANALSQVNKGPFVAGTVEAVRAATEQVAADARDYELRLLRIPAVYTIALWLHAGDADVLVPVAPAPAPLQANQAMDPAAFMEALRSFAASRLTSPDPTSST